MLSRIINYSLQHKLIIILFTLGLVGVGIHSIQNIPIGAVPDITNNQIQVITTSRDLSTNEVERYLTYPVELAMSNIPGVTEIRSISKFGLSVVTVVFEDKMGTYLPRQLIAERLVSVAEEIPEGFGTPFMGPISTGLGEIYQYILDVKPGYEDKYSTTDLRSIQDWVVKRQLAGIPGVVEVNTWGGFLKTYEVAVQPNKLRSYGIALSTVYEALSDNNALTGGGYIEKNQEAYFIRTEGLVKSLEDIGNIVLKSNDGAAIYVRDVATVRFGAATRFGAITGNGEGEKVLGQVMMLKGANSKKVIDDVKARVAEIQSSLPEGVYVNPFLERSALIKKTTHTVMENLILGFLIVLFVVVFLLGNLRSGLVVASVIPLTLLFAITMMRIFGVDANLMSLGAIDFGIIIDGAVIIVEYIAFSITSKRGDILAIGDKQARRTFIDSIVGKGADKMMHSAVFGQIIIIIVFIPILALTGVEGKMFRPMALTFCFALLGAMILCFTYVPVMSALFIKPTLSDKRNIATRFIDFVKSIYEPVLKLALRYKWATVGSSLVVFILSIALFSRMGAEFVPTLDEGDFVIQPVLKTGMSLEETVKMTTRIEQILKRYPEVKQVVSRIGAAEVPTDPMSMEESDVIITLQEKRSWTSAKSKDELAEVFKTALMDEIPGVEIEFTQPIEMRFNELISGARTDLAIKLFGEDLDLLYRKANEVERLVSTVEGAADITIEKIDGLPQMTVKYDRSTIARYGVNISQLNDIVSMGFAGKQAGSIFEQESKYDIVVRYDAAYRRDIEHLRQALVSLPDGQQLPLSTFADISYSTGPAKISRDNTKRRVVVGVNVRGRDLQSVVDEARALVERHIKLPTGYYFEYGGQLENLNRAKSRLLIAVPVALLLIFILLYFAFGTIRDALLIYTAIPLSTIGGILALYLRDMPFSISAGVGFVALFGIAVLNGIVMIEHFKELQTDGKKDKNDVILTAAKDRIRPVLLTAIAAALGFLPMAISTSAGAEVQRPLATVVIGGLISATLLTLVLLPVLYSLFGRFTLRKSKAFIGVFLILMFPIIAESQTPITMKEAIELALNNTSQAKITDLEVAKEAVLMDAASVYNPLEIGYSYDYNNMTESGSRLHVLGMGYEFKLPGVRKSLRAAQLARLNVQKGWQNYQKEQIAAEVSRRYIDARYHRQVVREYEQIQGLISQYEDAVKRRATLGASTELELLSVRQASSLNSLDTRKQRAAYKAALNHLNEFLQSAQAVVLDTSDYSLIVSEQWDNTSLLIAYYQLQMEAQDKQRAQIQKENLPSFKLGVFNGFERFDRFIFYPIIEAGISIPLSRKANRARQQAQHIERDIAAQRIRAVQHTVQLRRTNLEQRLVQLKEEMDIYDEQIYKPGKTLLLKAKKSLQSGQINSQQYLSILRDTALTRVKKWELIHEYNHTFINLLYLTTY